jgi:hypothetical protein
MKDCWGTPRSSVSSCRKLQLRRPRQWGGCWLALLLWRELQLDQFWCKRLGVSRELILRTATLFARTAGIRYRDRWVVWQAA